MDVDNHAACMISRDGFRVRGCIIEHYTTLFRSTEIGNELSLKNPSPVALSITAGVGGWECPIYMRTMRVAAPL